MKALLKLCVVVGVLLFALTACNLIKTIDVGWTINSFSEPAHDSFFDIAYDVSNSGKYDLSGVKLQFRMFLASGGYFTAWTPAFSISQNTIIKNNILTVDLYPYHITPGDFAEVIDVAMDKPTN